MEEKMVTIPAEEYRNLLEGFIRIKVFAEFVNSERYSIEKKDCARFLGFNIDDKED